MEPGNGETRRLRLTWHGRVRPPERPVLVTGVFDLLHVGHVRFLRLAGGKARTRGHQLVVGVEADERVRAWKGADRPINPASDRAEVLAALRPVDGVFMISGPPDSSGWELYAELLRPLRPVALAFTEGDPFSAAKRRGAHELGAEVWEMPMTEGRSSTGLIKASTGRTSRDSSLSARPR